MYCRVTVCRGCHSDLTWIFPPASMHGTELALAPRLMAATVVLIYPVNGLTVSSGGSFRDVFICHRPETLFSWVINH